MKPIIEIKPIIEVKPIDETEIHTSTSTEPLNDTFNTAVNPTPDIISIIQPNIISNPIITTQTQTISKIKLTRNSHRNVPNELKSTIPTVTTSIEEIIAKENEIETNISNVKPIEIEISIDDIKIETKAEIAESIDTNQFNEIKEETNEFLNQKSNQNSIDNSNENSNENINENEISDENLNELKEETLIDETLIVKRKPKVKPGPK